MLPIPVRLARVKQIRGVNAGITVVVFEPCTRLFYQLLFLLLASHNT
jgi:hypothetical protein